MHVKSTYIRIKHITATLSNLDQRLNRPLKEGLSVIACKHSNTDGMIWRIKIIN